MDKVGFWNSWIDTFGAKYLKTINFGMQKEKNSQDARFIVGFAKHCDRDNFIRMVS